MNTRFATQHTRVQIKKIAPRPTIKMSQVELDTILTVDAAIGARDAIHYCPTVQMKAVKVPA